MEDLVAQVKDMQRSDHGAKEQWGVYCDSQGGGLRDPAKHDPSFLETFINNYSAGLRFQPSAANATKTYQDGDTSKQAMVNEVKRLQREDQDARQQWWAYCDVQGAGVRDPMKHEAPFLETFLTNYNAGMRFESQTPDISELLYEGVSHDLLVAAVKRLQRSDPGAKDQWWGFSDSVGNGIRDPAKHDVAALQHFLSSYNQGMKFEYDKSLEKAPIVDLFKEGQRRSAFWKQAWGQYCDVFGAGKRDPAVHESRFLTAFLDHLGRSALMVPPIPPESAPKGKSKGGGKGDYGKNEWGQDDWSNSAQSQDWGTGDYNDWGQGHPPTKRPRMNQDDTSSNLKDQMVQRIKAFQRVGGGEWGEYCDSSMNGIRDPNKHDVTSLTAFISMYSVP